MARCLCNSSFAADFCESVMDLFVASPNDDFEIILATVLKNKEKKV